MSHVSNVHYINKYTNKYFLIPQLSLPVETNIPSIPAPLKLLDTSFSTHLDKLKERKKRNVKKKYYRINLNVKNSLA